MIDPVSLAITAAMKWGPSLIGSLMGDKAEKVAGDVVSIATSVTGITNPQEAIDALDKSPELVLRFRELLMDYQIKMAQEETKRLQAVNETMQAESKSEHWPQWSWRPFNGYMFGITLFMNYGLPPIVNMFIRGMGEAAKDGTYSLLVPGTVPEWVFMAWASVLGVTAWHRGVNKRVESGEAIQTPMDKLKGLVDRTLR